MHRKTVVVPQVWPPAEAARGQGAVPVGAAAGQPAREGQSPRWIQGATTEPVWVRCLLIAAALGFMTLFLFVPLISVFVEALKKGWDVYLASITEPDALSAIQLHLIVAGMPLTPNPAFRLAAACGFSQLRFLV